MKKKKKLILMVFGRSMMYWLGHLGYTSLIGNIIFWHKTRKKNGGSVNQGKAMSLLLFGALFPDIVDKPLDTFFGLSGRGYGHSLVFVSFIGVLSWYFLKHVSVFRSYFGEQNWWYLPVGMLCHLLEDNPFKDPDLVKGIFFPLKGWILLGTPYDYLFGYQDPWTIFFEVTGAIMLVFSIRYWKWEKKEKVILSIFVIVYLLTYMMFLVLIVF